MRSHREDWDPAAILRSAAWPLADENNVRRVLAEVGNASLVLLGEATHGTRECQEMRATITRALIEERGFNAVAIEGDGPDAYRINRYVREGTGGNAAGDAPAGSLPFPAMTGLVRWLREYNAPRSSARQVGFYGLDLYSQHASMQAVVDYLGRRDPVAARGARQSYAGFEEFGEDSGTYAWVTSRRGEGCGENAVARELAALRARRAELHRLEEGNPEEEFFFARQNARLAHNAEHYYRTMLRGRTASWNSHGRHMAETLDELCEHLRSRGQAPKVVVWAHNSHLGDARVTEFGEEGQLSLGQLVRERHRHEARLIGFTTYSGTALAASAWGGTPERKAVRPALENSHEDLLHRVGLPRFFIAPKPGTEVHALLSEPRLERAIGLIYHPDSERWSHYFHARLADQFDAIIHIDETNALDSVASTRSGHRSEAAEEIASPI